MDSTNTLPQILTTQSQKEVTANALFAAASPAMVFGRNDESSGALTWGFLGGRWGGLPVANGQIGLVPNATNRLVANRASGEVSLAGEGSPDLWSNPNYGRLYVVVTNGSGAQSWEDHRAGPGGIFESTGGGGGGGGDTPSLDDLTDVDVSGAANGDVLTFDADTSTWVAAAPEGGGGGLVNFTDTKVSAAPNSTYPVVALAAIGSEVSIDVAITPKGTNSAIVATVPDGTSAGGNKRGGGATDWQRERSQAVHVASGAFAVIGGGRNNRASGYGATVSGGEGNAASVDYTTVGGGNGNQSTQTYATVAGGDSNTATAQGSSIGGGSGNAASGVRSTIAGGQNNSASANWAAVVGGNGNVADGEMSTLAGYAAHADGVYGMRAVASGAFGGVGGGAGDAQEMEITLRGVTSSATPLVLTSNASGSSATNQLPLRNASALVAKGLVVVRDPSNGDYATWEFTAAARRGANAASTSLGTAVTPTLVFASPGAAAWTVSVTADTSDGCLAVTATGEAGRTLRWACSIRAVRVAGGA